jgi:hypothetical protein
MSSIRSAVRYGFSAAAIVGLIAFAAAPAAAQEPADPNPGAITLTGGVDFLNQYMFRGIRQNSTEMAMWPFGDVGLAVYSGDGGLKSASINFGVWNSLHTGDTGLDGPSGKLWYESDFYAALGLGFGGGTTLTTTYTAYTSPNSTFTTVKEFAFKVGVDDSAYLGGFALKPYATFAFEFDTEEAVGQADGGLEAGKYLELGVGPGWAADAVSVAFPVKVGLSMGDYYELDGEDNAFGFFSVGGIVTIPLGGTTSFGAWNLHGGVEYQRLGDTTAFFNSDEDGPQKNQIIGSFGIGFVY